MDWIFWLVIAVLFVIIECFTTQFISIWFALGAIIALLLSFLHQSVLIQLVAFIITGLGLAICLHPIIKKKMVRPKALNADGLVGQTAIVTEDFVQGEGRVLIDHVDWKAKADEELHQGDHVQVTAIHGVTVTVEKKGKDTEKWLRY